MIRQDNRQPEEIRPFRLVKNFQLHPAGSVLCCCGNTRVICAVSVEENVPRWMKEQNVPGGWITAEYQMLPSATGTRGEREVTKGRLSGRSAEIQRLVGRALRAVVDLDKLPGLTVHVDCDVIDADGGTRCASITGSCVALELAFQKLLADGKITESPLKERVAALSVGRLEGQMLADLCYVEDSAAEVDMNVIMTESGRFVEIQGTGEEATFGEDELAEMLALAKSGLRQIFKVMGETVSSCENR
jgi:ribonuclease PH